MAPGPLRVLSNLHRPPRKGRENDDRPKVIFMPLNELVALRNLKDGVTVLTPFFNDPKTYLEFQAAGDPSGGDIQYVSGDLVNSPACVKAIQHGVLALEEDTLSPEVAQAFRMQMEVAKRQREQARATIDDTIERTEQRDLVGETCVGPGNRPDVRCGDHVSVREKNLKDTPPLCARHAHMQTEYVPMVGYNGDKQTIEWIRSTMGPREGNRS